MHVQELAKIEQSQLTVNSAISNNRMVPSRLTHYPKVKCFMVLGIADRYMMRCCLGQLFHLYKLRRMIIFIEDKFRELRQFTKTVRNAEPVIKLDPVNLKSVNMSEKVKKKLVRILLYETDSMTPIPNKAPALIPPSIKTRHTTA